MPVYNLIYGVVGYKNFFISTKNRSDNLRYTEEELIRIAKRKNNKKRKYLIINPLQGKHIAAKPSKSLELFSNLAEQFKELYKNEKILLIGFAETATAIGIQIAIDINAKYIQTTREIIPNVEYLLFSEEHSHAIEQKIVKNDIDSVINEVDRIIFIEDEVTTGKTILNFIDILEKEYGCKFKYAVASVINGMNFEDLNIYKSKNINIHYLLKTDYSNYEEKIDRIIENGYEYKYLNKSKACIKKINIKGYINSRRMTNPKKYEKACDELWREIKKEIGNLHNEKILVVGTEEFMFPAIYIGFYLEKEGNDVFCHSTTRSPIEVSLEEDYPLHSRYELKSLYDSERKTFIYNISNYDRVLVITDSPEIKECQDTLINALSTKNKNILVVRWC